MITKSKSVAFLVIKSLISIYDFVTYPFYVVFCRPEKLRSKINRHRVYQTNPKDPESPWISSDPVLPSLATECRTFDEFIPLAAKTYGNRRCFGYRKLLEKKKKVLDDGKVITMKRLENTYNWFSYNEVNEKIGHISNGLLLSGVKSKDRVIIFMETRMEFMMYSQALFRIGAVTATLYATLGEEGIISVINQMGSTVIISSTDLIPKIMKNIRKTPTITTLIVVDDGEENENETDDNLNVILRKFEDKDDIIMNHGLSGIKRQEGKRSLNFVDSKKLEEEGKGCFNPIAVEKPDPDDTVLIMYTSGSTGIPKGVLMSHNNLMTSLRNYVSWIKTFIDRIEDLEYVYISYLPLAHTLEFLAELLLLTCGGAMGYSSPFTLTDRSVGLLPGTKGDATILKPHIMATVPLILDKIVKGINTQLETRSRLVSEMFEYMIQYKNHWSARGFDTPILNRILCKKFRSLMGGEIQIFFCGGAPLSIDTQQIISACFNVPLQEGWGATESTGVGTLMDPYEKSLGCSGVPLPGAQVKLVPWPEGGYFPSDKPNPRGELLLGGDFISQGYFNMKSETEEVFSTDNQKVRWYRTGDIGEVIKLPHASHTIKIVDRKKDFIKLQFGEFVSLGKVETELKTCSFIENICVYGDPYENHLIAFIVPVREEITRVAQTKFNKNTAGIEPEHFYSDPDVNNHLLDTLASHAKKSGLHKSEIPAAIKICTEVWDPDSGLVTAGLKIRRKQIQTFYEKDIRDMYQMIKSSQK